MSEYEGHETARRQAEEALRKSEQHYKELLEAVTDYVYTAWVDNGQVSSTRHHPGCASVTGYTTQDFENDGDLWLKMVHHEDSQKVKEHAELLLAEEKSSPIEHRIVHKNGSTRWVLNTPVVYRDDEGHVLYYEGIITDITLRKHAEQVVTMLSKALKYTADSVLITDQDGTIIFVNPAFEEKTGYSRSEAQHNTPRLLKSDAHDIRFFKNLWNIILSGKIYSGIIVNRKKDGSLYHEEKTISPIKDLDGKITHFVSVGRDITDRIQTEQKIQMSLREKEVLLQEIHHRVKNNLAIISGLLGLQADKIHDQTILERFKQAQDRVYSMSLIHEKLYQSTDLANLEAKDFIQTLADYLVSSYSLDHQQIELEVDIEPAWFNIDEAIPCGLIINELITNTLKHAFVPSQKGTIQIFLKNLGHECQLIVADNGKGIPEDVDIEETDSLGLMLVSGLTGQLNGTFTLDRSQGTRFEITFPLSVTV